MDTKILSQEKIQKDTEIKQEVLQKLFAGFQSEMKKIEDEQQQLLIEMIHLKQ